MKNDYNITVVVLTYNPVWEKLRATLKSIVEQQDVHLQVVITDDGSKNNYFDKVESYFKEIGFDDFKLISNKNNEGTVSLKHITQTSAEFGITVRKCAMGKGFSKFAMQHIIETGFKQLGLQKIYWCVAPENHRAVRFYDKNKFDRCLAPAEAQNIYSAGEINHYLWYEVVSG